MNLSQCQGSWNNSSWTQSHECKQWCNQSGSNPAFFEG